MTRQLHSPTIDVDELRAMLAERQPVTVLDIRKAEDRAEWAIPGSLHVDAYEALKAGDPGALADAAIPMDAPVVTVCGAGQGQPHRDGAAAGARLRRPLARRRHEGLEPGLEQRRGARARERGHRRPGPPHRQGLPLLPDRQRRRGRRHRCGPAAGGLSGPRGRARLDHHPRPGYPRPRRPPQPLPPPGRADRGDAPPAGAGSRVVSLHARSRRRHVGDRLLAD